MIQDLLTRRGETAEIRWVNGHSGVGNEQADILAGEAAKTVWSKVTSMAYLKLKISEKFRAAKQAWDDDPTNHGTGEIPPPLPKKSCLDKATARTAAQIRVNH